MTQHDRPVTTTHEPSAGNDFLTPHIKLLCASYRRWTGRDLVAPGTSPQDRARAIWQSPMVIASHGIEADPVFNYANRAALRLWKMDWTTFTRLPSRYSAEPVAREERERLLMAVTTHGYIDDYSGVRIASDGSRFRIERATVWNVVDTDNTYRGQAVVFGHWELLQNTATSPATP